MLVPPDGAPALEQTFDRIAALLGLTASSSQIAQLAGFHRLLQRWGQRYNLTSIRDPGATVTLHFADCMAAVPPLQRWLRERDASTLLDVGSGGGLPGAVFAILCPALDVTCVDAVAKKIAFIRQLAVELRIASLRGVHARVERLDGRFDVICTRAFAPLQQTVALTRHVMRDDGCWLSMKGKRPDAEIDALPPDVRVFHVEPIRVPDLDAERCLVWISRNLPRSGELG